MVKRSAIDSLLERYRVDISLRDEARLEVNALQARLDEAVALLHHAEATLSRCAGLGRGIPRPTQHEVMAEVETFRAFFSTLDNGGA